MLIINTITFLDEVFLCGDISDQMNTKLWKKNNNGFNADKIFWGFFAFFNIQTFSLSLFLFIETIILYLLKPNFTNIKAYFNKISFSGNILVLFMHAILWEIKILKQQYN